MRKLATANIFCVIAVFTSFACNRSKDANLANKQANRKIITIGISQEPDTLFMPFKEMMASEEVSRVGNYTLTIFDENWKLRPWAAKEIPTLQNGKLELFTENGAQKMRTTWEIRDEFFWPDGEPLTADDFVFAYDVLKDPTQEVIDRTTVEKIERMEAKGTNHKTLVVTWKEPYAYYHNFRQHEALPRHMLEAIYKSAPEKFKKNDFGSKPALAGAFTIKDWSPGNFIMAVRNTRAQGFVKPSLDEVVWKIIPQTNTLEANLVSGTVDAISTTGLDIDQAIQFEARHGKDFDFYYTQGLVWEHIDFNLDNPILKDKNVRKALAHGANREGIAKSMFNGKQLTAHGTEPPKSPYYNPNVQKYPYDVTKANALLDEAGWKMGEDGIRQKGGQPLSLTLMSTSGNKTRERYEQLLQADWRKIGVDLEIKNQPAKVFFGDTLRKRKYPHMAMYSWVKDPLALSDTLWRCDYIPKPSNNFMGQNQPGFCDKRTDDLLKKASRELDDQKRAKIGQDVEAILAEELPSLPLFFRVDVSVTKKGLVGWKPTGTLQPLTWNVQEWHWIN